MNIQNKSLSDIHPYAKNPRKNDEAVAAVAASIREFGFLVPLVIDRNGEIVESVNETEAGTDQIIVTRYDKLTVAASFQCTSTWAGKFKAYSKQDSVTVRMYDLESHGYKEREMRLRGFKAVPAEHSERTGGTDGLWTVSFTLEEF